MKDCINKYAKDLCPGDKINGHEKGWITVIYRKRINLSAKTMLIFSDNEEPQIMDSHTLFENVIVDC